MTEFDTYQEASTISRKTMDWKRSKISKFELDVVPQSWMPYVQMGLSITLYMRSLLLVESLDFRPSNQYTLVSERPSCLRLAKMCVCQVRRQTVNKRQILLTESMQISTTW
jgi:hypothetical protein